MKRQVLIFFVLAMFFGSQAQTLTVSVPTVTATVGQIVYIPVKLAGASSSGVPISGANIQISYDTAVLHYDSLTNFYSAMPQSQWFFAGHNGLVSANWLEPSLLTLAIPDNTTFYEIKFTYKGGNSPLTFMVNEFTDALYNIIPTAPVNGAVNAPVVFRQVTFRVDMITQNISTDGVHISGTFQGWNPAATPMINSVDSVFSYSDSLPTGTLVQYKFVNGNSAANYETVPPACAANGSRTLLVPANDTILKLVCFSECDTCILTGSTERKRDDLTLFQNFPNPFSGITQIGYRINQEGFVKLAVYGSMGQMVSVLFCGPSKPGAFSVPLNTSDLAAGIYYYQMTFTGRDRTSVQSKMMIVK